MEIPARSRISLSPLLLVSLSGNSLSSSAAAGPEPVILRPQSRTIGPNAHFEHAHDPQPVEQVGRVEQLPAAGLLRSLGIEACKKNLRLGMAAVIHAGSAVITIAIWIIHVYAAIWVRGTISAMTRGSVTGGWAWRHHRKWLRKEISKDPGGRQPAE